ncbi:MAG TPA: outer membrane beta-barrel protein [Saprospiraceae bacterium]|nr:outer membrane beta-barrel protein [Saprospiraceae bacterium]
MHYAKHLCWVLCTFACTLFAQTQSRCVLEGRVADEKGMPVELATVVLKTAKDSVVIEAGYTEKDGSFRFANLAAGNYLVEVVFVGFEKHLGQVVLAGGSNSPVLYPPIQLNPAQQQLSEVTVTARRPYVERLADRTIINPDVLIANAGSSALEALERAPGVQVGEGGDIRLRGRSGVAIFVDDKPTYLSGTELESYLRSIPADNVKHIELMPNPPAKYEAAGNSGVINIVTKRNRIAGFNGNTSLAFAQGRFNRSNNSLNLNLNRKNFGLFVNLGAGHRNFFQDLNIFRFYTRMDGDPSSNFAQNSYIVPRSQSLNAKLGLDLYLSDKTTLGLVVKGLTSPNERQTDNTAIVRAPFGAILNTVIADNAEKSSFANGAYNLNLRHRLDSLGSNIIVDADYVTYRTDADQFFQNFIYDSSGTLGYADTIQGRLPSYITIYAAKADYTKPFAHGLKMEAGLKSAFTQTDNEAAYTTTRVGQTYINYDLSNRFLYDEWIHAGYLNFSKTFGRLDLQAGLRVEHTSLKGNQLGNEFQPGSKFSRNYTQPFPTLYANLRLDSLDKNTLSFSYGRRIDRPFFKDLNPFISPLDKFTFYTGNPNLLPTFAHNLSLTHSFQGKVNTTLSYSKTLDGINETLEIVNEIYYSRPGNIANSQSIGLSLEATLPVAKWWTLMLYAAADRVTYKSDLYTQRLDATGYNGYISMTNSLQLGKGWSGEVRADYQTNQVYAQLLILNFGTLNLAAAKKIWKDAATIKLSAQDLLYTRRGSGIINNLELTEANWNSRFDSRVLNLSFSYRFGKVANQRQRHNSSGSESEQQRVRS